MLARPLALAALVSFAGLSSAAAAPDCDNSTNAGVAAAYRTATGKKLASPACTTISKTFVGLAAVGSQEDGGGCHREGVLVGCVWNPADAARTAMAKAGWAKADVDARKTLAIAWLFEIEGMRAVAAEPKGFAASGKVFTPIVARAEGKTLVLQFWERMPPGSAEGALYLEHKIVFGEDGSPGKRDELDRAETP